MFRIDDTGYSSDVCKLDEVTGRNGRREIKRASESPQHMASVLAWTTSCILLVLIT